MPPSAALRIRPSGALRRTAGQRLPAGDAAQRPPEHPALLPRHLQSGIAAADIYLRYLPLRAGRYARLRRNGRHRIVIRILRHPPQSQVTTHSVSIQFDPVSMQLSYYLSIVNKYVVIYYLL